MRFSSPLLIFACLLVGVAAAPRSALAACPALGREIAAAIGKQERPKTTSDGSGGAIAVWPDGATACTDFDLHGQFVLTAASLSVDPVSPPAGIAFASVAPNPVSGAVTLRFTLPHAASAKLAIFDPAGRRIREVTLAVDGRAVPRKLAKLN